MTSERVRIELRNVCCPRASVHRAERRDRNAAGLAAACLAASSGDAATVRGRLDSARAEQSRARLVGDSRPPASRRACADAALHDPATGRWHVTVVGPTPAGDTARHRAHTGEGLEEEPALVDLMLKLRE